MRAIHLSVCVAPVCALWAMVTMGTIKVLHYHDPGLSQLINWVNVLVHAGLIQWIRLLQKKYSLSSSRIIITIVIFIFLYFAKLRSVYPQENDLWGVICGIHQYSPSLQITSYHWWNCCRRLPGHRFFCCREIFNMHMGRFSVSYKGLDTEPTTLRLRTGGKRIAARIRIRTHSLLIRIALI